MEQIGYIYKLECLEHFYYGSTTSEIEKRLYSHKQDGTTNPRMSGNRLYSHINSIGWNNVKISLVEEIKFMTKAQLRQAENKYIVESLSNPLCLNSNRSVVTIEERKALVSERNTRVQLAKHSQIVCDCGMLTTVGRKQHHLNSMNHKLSVISNVSQRDGIDKADQEIPSAVQ